jgi:hypothetical protein
MPILKNQDQKVYEFNESHLNHLSEIIQKYTHAEIVRNTADLEPEHFRDISHLNAEGALVFSQAMSSTLKARCEKFE